MHFVESLKSYKIDDCLSLKVLLVGLSPFFVGILLSKDSAKLVKILEICKFFVARVGHHGPHGPHAKGAKVVGAQGDLAMERRLPAAARRHMVTSMTGIGKLR